MEQYKRRTSNKSDGDACWKFEKNLSGIKRCLFFECGAWPKYPYLLE